MKVPEREKEVPLKDIHLVETQQKCECASTHTHTRTRTRTRTSTHTHARKIEIQDKTEAAVNCKFIFKAILRDRQTRRDKMNSNAIHITRP